MGFQNRLALFNDLLVPDCELVKIMDQSLYGYGLVDVGSNEQG